MAGERLGGINFGNRVYSAAAVDALLEQKQDVLTFDDEPTEYSVNPVTSDGIKRALDAIEEETGRNFAPKYVTVDSNDVELSSLAVEIAGLVDEIEMEVADLSVGLSDHVDRTDNPHGVTKAQVGLGNADDTSDMDKPVSTAVQSALNLKANSADLAAVATSGSYNDLLDRPTIPVVNDATLTIRQQGVDKATFTANSSTDAIVDIVEVDPVFVAWKNSYNLSAGPNASAAASGGGSGNIAIGWNAKATANGETTAIGANSSALGLYSVAIGKNTVSSSGSSVAIGNSATASNDSNAVAIGHSAQATSFNAIQLGEGTNSSARSLQFRDTQIVNGSGKIVSSNLDSDSTPTANSTRTVTSGGIRTALDAKQDQFVVLKYGVSTWAEFQEAYRKNAVIFCLNGSRMGIVGYVTATQVEFNYYRSIQRHTASNQGDQFFVYKLDESDTWSSATRETMLRNVSGNGIETTVVEQAGLGTISYAVKPKTGGGIGVDANGVYVDLSSLSSVSSQISAVKNGTAGGTDVVDVLGALLLALGA